MRQVRRGGATPCHPAGSFLKEKMPRGHAGGPSGHLGDFADAYNFARRFKTLSGLTPSRIHLQNLDFAARPVHPKSDPQDAGSKHPSDTPRNSARWSPAERETIKATELATGFDERLLDGTLQGIDQKYGNRIGSQGRAQDRPGQGRVQRGRDSRNLRRAGPVFADRARQRRLRWPCHGKPGCYPGRNKWKTVLTYQPRSRSPENWRNSAAG